LTCRKQDELAAENTGAMQYCGMSTFTPAPIKPTISFAVIDSLDVRLGTIQAVDDVAGSKKLMKLTVSFGDHTRSILAGLKQERPAPHELIGRQTLFVVNLPPKSMAGEISEGMLFDIGYADGLTPALALPERSLPDGARAG
jgi:tRNA-binding protein